MKIKKNKIFVKKLNKTKNNDQNFLEPYSKFDITSLKTE